MSELHALVEEAAGSVRAPRVSDRRDERTLGEILRNAEDLAGRIAAAAVRDRPVVLARVPATIEAVELLLAAVVGDFAICFVDPSAPAERADAILAGLDPDVVAGSGELTSRHPDGEGVPASGYVATSSGTTGGGPKGVLSSWTCMAEFVPHGATALGLGPGDCLAEPSHPAYDLSMTNWLLALASGASLAVSHALTDRVRPLAFAGRAGATHVRLAPRFIDLARAERERSAPPLSLRVWGSGGDRLSHRQAESVFGLGVPTLVNTYGTSETAGFASAATFDDVRAVTSRHGSVSIGTGRVGPWRTALVEERRDDRTTGMLAISAPHLTTGYLMGGGAGVGGEPTYPRWEADRVVTGDLGCASGDELFCLGRSGRLVKRSGIFVNLDDVDRVLRERCGVDTMTVAIRSGELVTLVAPASASASADMEGLRQGLAAHVSPDSRPDVLIPVARVPRLANGKSDHAQAVRMAEQVAAGES